MLLDLYAFSFASSTGLGTRISAEISTTPSNLLLDAGEKYLYDFETQDKSGVLEVEVMRDLEREFLMKGRLTGNFKRPDGSIAGEFDEYRIDEHFLVNKHTGTSPGSNYFSGLWNYCGGILLYLADAGSSGGSRCYLTGGPGMEEITVEHMPGIVPAMAAPVITFSDARITFKSKISVEKTDQRDATADFALFLNLALAGLLAGWVIKTMQFAPKREFFGGY